MKFTKKTLKRAARTFIQAALATMLVDLATVDFSVDGAALKSTMIGLAVSALAAGIAAAMNLEQKGEIEE